MKLGPGGEPENLDPEISKIVDEIMARLLDLYHDDTRIKPVARLAISV
jgi:hypothetical protein